MKELTKEQFEKLLKEAKSNDVIKVSDLIKMLKQSYYYKCNIYDFNHGSSLDLCKKIEEEMIKANPLSSFISGKQICASFCDPKTLEMSFEFSKDGLFSTIWSKFSAYCKSVDDILVINVTSVAEHFLNEIKKHASK